MTLRKKNVWNLNMSLKSCEDAFVKLLCHIHLAGRVVAMQELLYKCGVTWPTLAWVLLYCSNAAVPRCCQGDDFAMLLPWFFALVLECCCLFPVAMQLLCRRRGFCLCCFVVLVLAHFDLYVTSAPVGHHAPLQPLVTGPHLHPSPASSPPSSSSPSTLPSSSQSSVTGPPRFSFSYPLFPHDFSFSQGELAVCKCCHFILSLFSTDSASLVCPVCSEYLCLIHQLLPLSPYQQLVALLLKKTDVTL